MKKILMAVFATIVWLATWSADGQPGRMGGGGMMGGGPRGVDWSGKWEKLFGENQAFTADIEMQNTGGRGMNMPGKMAVDSGKSRFEMDMMKGGSMPEGAAAQMKSMGMDKMIMISRPDKKVSYLIYPGLNAYVENPIPDKSGADQKTSEPKIEYTELGKETVDRHPTVKTKAVYTDDDGKKHEATLWYATDLKKFPIKVEQQEQGMTMTLLFKDVKLAKPDASLFDPPADMKKYDSMQALMQEEMMKRMGGAGFPGRK